MQFLTKLMIYKAYALILVRFCDIISPKIQNLTKDCDSMKLKHRIVFEILLVIAAIAIFVYNFSMQREIAYIASIVAVCGTIAFLIKDIIKLKRDK